MLADRKTGKLIETIYEAPPFFSFHHGNAFEKDGHIIIDLSHYENGKIMNDLNLKNIKENKGNNIYPFYTRFVIPLHVEVIYNIFYILSIV